MRKIWIIMLILVLITSFYIVGINYVAQIKLYNSQELQKENITTTSGADVDVNMNELVSVNIKRNRWYGTIYGQYGSEKSIENLYLFNLIKIPIKVNGTNWGYYHIGVLGTLIFLFINILFIDLLSRKNTQKLIINTPLQ